MSNITIDDIYRQFDKLTAHLTIEERLNLINEYENILILGGRANGTIEKNNK